MFLVWYQIAAATTVPTGLVDDFVEPLKGERKASRAEERDSFRRATASSHKDRRNVGEGVVERLQWQPAPTQASAQNDRRAVQPIIRHLVLRRERDGVLVKAFKAAEAALYPNRTPGKPCRVQFGVVPELSGNDWVASFVAKTSRLYEGGKGVYTDQNVRHFARRFLADKGATLLMRGVYLIEREEDALSLRDFVSRTGNYCDFHPVGSAGIDLLARRQDTNMKEDGDAESDD